MAQWRRSQRNLLVGALLALVSIAGIYAFSSGAFDPRRPPMIDGFPIGAPVSCQEQCAEWTRLRRAALDQREHAHVEIVGMRVFREGHIPDLYGPGVLYTRSGMLNVVVFDLPDGSVRATGVYCGPGGCRGWTEFNVGKVVGTPHVFHASAPEHHASAPQHHASTPDDHGSGIQGP
jgi:hypothetical protein